MLSGESREPKRILALCFKVDATKNLRSRTIQRCGERLAQRFDAFTFHGFAKSLIDRFRLAIPLQDRPSADYTVGRSAPPGVISFADMIPLASKLLAHSPEIRRAIQWTYSHVFLDEFQDCTDKQYSLVRGLFLGSDVTLTAVGDRNQSIMQWEKALPKIFDDFIRDFGAKRYDLLINHRSDPYLQYVQNKIVEVIEPARLVKPIYAEGGSVTIYGFDTSEQEAAALSTSIGKLLEDELVPPREVAIIVRKADLIDPLHRSLQAAGIPVRDETDGFQDVLAEPISEAILAWFRILLTKDDKEATRCLLSLALRVRGIENEDDPREIALIKAVNSGKSQFRPKIDHTSSSFEQFQPALAWLIDSLLQRERIRGTWPQYCQGIWLDKTISELSKGFQSARRRTAGWLEALDVIEGRTAVRIMTIHKSKGLEFNTVVLMGLEDQAFFGPIDEEWCCLFVALSRAKHRIWITATRNRPELDRDRVRSRSRKCNGFYQCLYGAGVLESWGKGNTLAIAP